MQLVLASRFDPPLRQHRLRMSGQLCELRDEDLYFSLAESRDLLANFGVQVAAGQLEPLHQASEGWPAALQMAALSLRGTADPGRIARALEVRSHTIADYFISEVLDQQPPELVQFMLDTSILGQLTPAACAAVTGRHDAAAMLRRIDTAHLFLVALDDEQETFRYHRLVRQVLHAELRARDRDREPLLHQRAAEYFEQTGDTSRATRHFLAARQVNRALDLMQDRVLTDFLQNPAPPGTLDLSMITPATLTDSPDQLLTVAANLLIRGDTAHAGEYLDLPRPRPPSDPAGTQTRRPARGDAVLPLRPDRPVGRGRGRPRRARGPPGADTAHRRVGCRRPAGHDAPLRQPGRRQGGGARGGRGSGDTRAHRAGQAGAAPQRPGTGLVRGRPPRRRRRRRPRRRRAAERLGFDQHFFAVDYLRTLAGLALERRDLDTAEHLTEQALSITEHQRPIFEYLALLDRAAIWAARGQTSEALATVDSARAILSGTRSPLLARADEAEALLRLSLGDLRTPAKLATRLPAARRTILLARIALAAGDHHAAREHLHSPALGDLTPRRPWCASYCWPPRRSSVATRWPRASWPACSTPPAAKASSTPS